MNLLGAEQSGFISDIGFEMYQRILADAVKDSKNNGKNCSREGARQGIMWKKLYWKRSCIAYPRFICKRYPREDYSLSQTRWNRFEHELEDLK